MDARNENLAEKVLDILAARDIPVNDKARRRIVSCQDQASLDHWFDRARKASSLNDIFELDSE